MLDWNLAIQQVFLPIVGTVLTGAITWGAAALQKRTNIQLQQKDMDALHSAVMTGVTAALVRKGITPGGLASGAPISPTDVAARISSDVIMHVSRSVPQALKRLEPSTQVMENLIFSKLGEVFNKGA